MTGLAYASEYAGECPYCGEQLPKPLFAAAIHRMDCSPHKDQADLIAFLKVSAEPRGDGS